MQPRDQNQHRSQNLISMQSDDLHITTSIPYLVECCYAPTDPKIKLEVIFPPVLP